MKKLWKGPETVFLIKPRIHPCATYLDQPCYIETIFVCMRTGRLVWNYVNSGIGLTVSGQVYMHGYGCGMGNQIHLSLLSLSLSLSLFIYIYLSLSLYLSLFNYRSRFIFTDMEVGWVIRFISLSSLSLSLSLYLFLSLSSSSQ